MGDYTAAQGIPLSMARPAQVWCWEWVPSQRWELLVVTLIEIWILYHILCPGSSTMCMSCFVQTTPLGLFFPKINISKFSSRPFISSSTSGSVHHFACILIILGESFSYLTITHSRVVTFSIFTANPVRNAFILHKSIIWICIYTNPSYILYILMFSYPILILKTLFLTTVMSHIPHS